MDERELDALIGGPDVPAEDEPVGDEPVGADDEPAIEAGDGASHSYRLLVPLKVDGRWLRKVTMRLPTQGDIDDWGSGEVASPRALFCRLTGLHPAVAKALRWPDSERLHLMFSEMLPEFMQTP